MNPEPLSELNAAPEPAETQSSDQVKEVANGSSGGTAVNLSRVARVVVPFVLLLVAAFLFFGVFDGAQWFSNLLKPDLVPVRGEVLFEGKPLTNGQVTTRHMDRGLRGSLGFIEPDGTFELKTDIDGRLVPGAYPGEHKVTIAAFGMQAPASAPPLLTPSVYASFASTPLTIRIEPGNGPTDFKFVLQGSSQQPASHSDPSRPADREGSRQAGESVPEKSAK